VLELRADERGPGDVADHVTVLVFIADSVKQSAPPFSPAQWVMLWPQLSVALSPVDVHLQAGTVTVRRNRVELLESPVAFDAAPKTDAGRWLQ
jgi:hypothetical protein